MGGIVAGIVWMGLLIFSGPAMAADFSFPGGEIQFGEQGQGGLTTPLKLVLLLTVLSLAPSLFLMVTSFTRIIIVLSMLRHALGMPETPPNSILISLGLFLTLFTMTPVWNEINEKAIEPYTHKQLADDQFAQQALAPIRKFMLAQAREKDIRLMLELSRAEMPKSPDELKTTVLVPAFMISELRHAFEIGFVIFLPFVMIDMIVASVLMSLGMIMVPPVAFSLPLKILLFVLIDGWNLLAAGLVKSFVVT